MKLRSSIRSSSVTWNRSKAAFWTSSECTSRGSSTRMTKPTDGFRESAPWSLCSSSKDRDLNPWDPTAVSCDCRDNQELVGLTNRHRARRGGVESAPGVTSARAASPLPFLLGPSSDTSCREPSSPPPGLRTLPARMTHKLPEAVGTRSSSSCWTNPSVLKNRSNNVQNRCHAGVNARSRPM